MKSSFPIFTVGAIVLSAILVAGYFISRPAPQTHPPVQVEKHPATTPPGSLTGEIQREPPNQQAIEFHPAPAAGPAPANNVIQPPQSLNNSDAIVLQAMQALSPELAKYLIPEDQISKWVLAIDKMADGKLLKRYRPLEYPMKPFAVKTYGEVSIMADKNYQRLTPLIKSLTSIPPTLLADYYQAWRPLLEDAYEQLGKAGTFDERLHLAIEKLLAVKPLKEKGLLIRPNVFYVYQDDSLEQATDIEKLGWRMGHENLNALQNYFREFQYEIAQR